MAEPLRIALAGLGTVGTGVIELLAANRSTIERRAGRPLEIVAVNARDRARDRGVDLSPYEWVAAMGEFATRGDIDVVVELIGGAMTSFYDWYADLPVASPQVFGDQTDVPESGDWWDAAYLMMWGSNVPITRTPDAHWMAEARYRGTKVVTVSPDYADNTKFADEWMTEYKCGSPHFRELRGEGEHHSIEEVGSRLRGLMPWMESQRIVDKSKN